MPCGCAALVDAIGTAGLDAAEAAARQRQTLGWQTLAVNVMVSPALLASAPSSGRHSDPQGLVRKHLTGNSDDSVLPAGPSVAALESSI